MVYLGIPLRKDLLRQIHLPKMVKDYCVQQPIGLKQPYLLFNTLASKFIRHGKLAFSRVFLRELLLALKHQFQLPLVGHSQLEKFISYNSHQFKLVNYSVAGKKQQVPLFVSRENRPRKYFILQLARTLAARSEATLALRLIGEIRDFDAKRGATYKARQVYYRTLHDTRFLTKIIYKGSKSKISS